MNIFLFKVRISLENSFLRLTRSEKPEDGAHRDPQTPNAGLSSHDSRIVCDAWYLHDLFLAIVIHPTDDIAQAGSDNQVAAIGCTNHPERSLLNAGQLFPRIMLEKELSELRFLLFVLELEIRGGP